MVYQWIQATDSMNITLKDFQTQQSVHLPIKLMQTCMHAVKTVLMCACITWLAAFALTRSARRTALHRNKTNMHEQTQTRTQTRAQPQQYHTSTYLMIQQRHHMVNIPPDAIVQRNIG